MNYRIEGTLKKGKTTIIVSIILWLLIAIVFVIPVTCANYQTELLGKFDTDAYLSAFSRTISNPITGIRVLLKYNLLLKFFKNLFGFTIFYLIIVAIGLIRLMPKHRYDNVEHGSSDWSEHGEQYKILSKKAGIII